MANFLESLFAQLNRADDRVVLREIRGEQFLSVAGSELLEQVGKVRAFLRHSGIQPGDRCALLAPNSIAWVAIDLAMMAEGVIVVPLYARQAADELAGMMKDCRPRLLFVGDAAPGEALAQAWHDAPPRVTLDQALNENVSKAAGAGGAVARADSEIVTIIYTSGTSGEPKGVCLNVGNLNYMLGRTTERLGQLMTATGGGGPDRVFHYLPFNFAASWQRQKAASASATDRLWLWLAKKLIFSKIKARFGHDLRALICGSAPLAPETQQFFQMLGIPVLQAYGLTETTGICTMDDPREPAEPGYVGSAIP